MESEREQEQQQQHMPRSCPGVQGSISGHPISNLTPPKNLHHDLTLLIANDSDGEERGLETQLTSLLRRKHTPSHQFRSAPSPPTLGSLFRVDCPAAAAQVNKLPGPALGLWPPPVLSPGPQLPPRSRVARSPTPFVPQCVRLRLHLHVCKLTQSLTEGTQDSRSAKKVEAGSLISNIKIDIAN